jgi:hypothetical protein
MVAAATNMVDFDDNFYENFPTPRQHTAPPPMGKWKYVVREY